MTKRKIEYWVIPPDQDAEFVADMENVLETYAEGLFSITGWSAMCAGGRRQGGRRPSLGWGGSREWVDVMDWRVPRPFVGSDPQAEGCREGRVCDPEDNARR
jgi:hypothetical protein